MLHTVNNVLAAQNKLSRFGNGFVHGAKAIFVAVWSTFPHHLNNAYQVGHLVGVLAVLIVGALLIVRFT